MSNEERGDSSTEDMKAEMDLLTKPAETPTSAPYNRGRKQSPKILSDLLSDRRLKDDVSAVTWDR
ncbi:hypothetical protein ACQEU3_46330 [Spirillospora sp. CA-253888]